MARGEGGAAAPQRAGAARRVGQFQPPERSRKLAGVVPSCLKVSNRKPLAPPSLREVAAQPALAPGTRIGAPERWEAAAQCLETPGLTA